MSNRAFSILIVFWVAALFIGPSERLFADEALVKEVLEHWKARAEAINTAHIVLEGDVSYSPGYVVPAYKNHETGEVHEDIPKDWVSHKHQYDFIIDFKNKACRSRDLGMHCLTSSQKFVPMACEYGNNSEYSYSRITSSPLAKEIEEIYSKAEHTDIGMQGANDLGFCWIVASELIPVFFAMGRPTSDFNGEKKQLYEHSHELADYSAEKHEKNGVELISLKTKAVAPGSYYVIIIDPKQDFQVVEIYDYSSGEIYKYFDMKYKKEAGAFMLDTIDFTQYLDDKVQYSCKLTVQSWNLNAHIEPADYKPLKMPGDRIVYTEPVTKRFLYSAIISPSGEEVREDLSKPTITNTPDNKTGYMNYRSMLGAMLMLCIVVFLFRTRRKSVGHAHGA